MRAGNDGGLWVSRPRWARTPDWLGEQIDAPDERRGTAGLVARWLYVLADDLEPVAAPKPWAALLPGLDPTTMGWLGRDWYLGAHRELLFEEEAGTVELQLLEDVGGAGRSAAEGEAEALGDWLGGRRVMARFPSPLSRGPRSRTGPAASPRGEGRRER